MAAVDLSKTVSFYNTSRGAEDDISKVLSTSRVAGADGHWENWSAFFRDMDLYTLLV